MINTTLYKKEIKSNYILFLIFAAVLTMYGSMIVAMFDPKMGDSLRAMAESMPQIFAAFGMTNVGTTLLEFVTTYLYGMLYVAFPGVFIIILSGRLIARYVDNGSMAYLLAVPEKRRKTVVTQAVFLLTCLVLLVLYITLLIIVISHLMFPGELETQKFIQLNVGLLGVLIFFGGACFLPSCLFNESRIATGIGAGIVIYSILMQMISQVGDKFEFLKYATPLTLFDAKGLAAAQSNAWIGCGALYTLGIIMIIIGIAGFSKRNLPV